MEMKGYRRRFTKRSKYQRLNSGSKKTWRVKRLRWRIFSPRNLWTSFKNAYLLLMSNMAGRVGGLTARSTAFSTQKLPARATSRRISSNDQFHDRSLTLGTWTCYLGVLEWSWIEALGFNLHWILWF
ncbi:hypothetical protein HanPSC8_Chr09g0380581 [Helianthus annuus]|nr:hypothetical protein HanPSC8_Chr09g0380581 [Helianthus annuus]